MFDLRHPFFRPLWSRALVTGLALGWALVELSAGNTGWALLFGAAGGWCFYQFFVVFDPADYTKKDEDDG